MFRSARSSRRKSVRRHPRWVGGAGWLAVACALLGCTESVLLGIDRSAPIGADAAAGAGGTGALFPIGGAAGESAGGGGAALPIDAGPCVPVTCGGTRFACGDCDDNDGDGRSDASDPQCLGPCDDSESELSSGIDPRVTGACRSDCYFDRNAGSGDDGCGWSFSCDPLSVAPDYPPTGSAMCSFSPGATQCDPSSLAVCEAGCLPLTPNGCDCFGCCELPAHSGRFVWLGSEALDDARCDLDSDDPRACKRCTPVPDCQNPCDQCELCVGKPDLPSACASGGPACGEGVLACDPLVPNVCGSQAYCITGCCVRLPQ
jgi:hypothetical protein